MRETRSETAALRLLIWEASQPHPFARLLMLEQLGIPDRKKPTLDREAFRSYCAMKPPPKVCHRGHDLTVEGRLRVYRYNYGVRYSCLECTNENNRRHADRRAKRKKPAICKVCGKNFLTANCALVCSGACQNSYVSRQTKAGMRHQKPDGFAQMNAAALLELHAQRDRCATHWERAEVDALIEAKKKEML